jgi:hypothetical protein
MYKINNDWKYKQSLYSNFNNELMSGINQGLSLYNPKDDLKLYKPIDLKPLDDIKSDDNKNINEDNKTNKDKKEFSFTDLLNSLLMPSPIIGGNLGTDLVNYHNYKIGNDKEFNSDTLKFYKPLTDIIGVYDKELYIILGISLLGLILYKKI